METKLVNLIVNDSLSSIYLCDAQTLKLLYVNERIAKTLNKSVADAAGKTCYEYLKGRTEPCENCFLHECNERDFTIKEYTSDMTGRSYLMRGKIILWQGRRALLEYLTDETERIESQRAMTSLIDGLPGGAGIYTLYQSGVLDCEYLNEGYFSLLGIERAERTPFARQNTLKAVHPDDSAHVKQQLHALLEGAASACYDYRVFVRDGVYKWMNVRVNAVEREIDRVKLYACFTDIDEFKTAQLSLESSQRALEIAARAQRMSFWIYYLDTHELSKEFRMASPLKQGRVPESILDTGDVHEHDEPELRAMYEALFSGAPKCECTVRVLNRETNVYEWQHLLYNRLDDKLYGRPAAIGCSVNADLQQEAKRQYQSEQQLRREIVRSSVSSYQVNITKRTVEEHTSVLNDRPLMFAGAWVTPELDAQLLEGIPEEDRALVRDTLFADGMEKHFKRGETALRAVYRRFFEGKGYRYVVSNASIMQRPGTGDVVGFVYTRDIDTEKKNSIAIEGVLAEEIETVAIVHVASKMAHFAKVTPHIGLEVNKEFIYDRLVSSIMERAIHEDDRAAYGNALFLDNMLAALKHEDVLTITYREFDHFGKLRRKKSRAFFLDNTKADIVVIRRDITDLYLEEQHQKQALEKAAAEAKVANKAKSAFISRMSHDMRTPLNAVLALSGKELTEGISEEEKDEHLRQIHSSGEYLLGIINDVLDMSRIESRKLTLNPEPCPRAEFLSTLNVVIGEQCRQKGINFVLKGSPAPRLLMLDKVRLKQIFINLLANAVKFTPPGGTVSYTSNELSCEDGVVLTRFVVKDTGIGMSKEFLPHAFESFSQENRPSGAEIPQGTGLGLSIVKQLVELMDGSIEVKSELNKGTEFTVTIPLKLATRADAMRYGATRMGVSADAVLGAGGMFGADGMLDFGGADAGGVGAGGADAGGVGAGGVDAGGVGADGRGAASSLNGADTSAKGGSIPPGGTGAGAGNVDAGSAGGVGDAGGAGGVGAGGVGDARRAALSREAERREAVGADGKERLSSPKGADTPAEGDFMSLLDGADSASDARREALSREAERREALQREAEARRDEQTRRDKTIEKLNGAKVLLCEDNALNARIVESLLGKKGCAVMCASNGQAGLEMFFASDIGYYDAILMDIRMPIMNGIDTTRAIRALHRKDAKTIPIIAMTADAFIEDMQSSQDAGMNGHLTKPVEPAKLYMTLAEAIAN